MYHWRIFYYLLQFYLFAVSGALGYLSLRAWLDPNLYRRRKEDPYRSPRWKHLLRGIGFLLIATAAIIGALKEGATGIGMNAVALMRLGGYGLVLGLLPRSLFRHKIVLFGIALVIAGESMLLGHSSQSYATGLVSVLPYAGLLAIDCGLGLLGTRLARTTLRVRLVDRLVISFAVFSLLLAQMVGVLFVGMLSSFTDISAIFDNAEKPLLMTLSAVLVTSALIGFFLARDLSEPVTDLAKTLRSIGEGNLDQRAQLSHSNSDDELHDLAHEVNRMAGQLKAAEEMRADFFSFVSHELRTPLTSIHGFITTLESIDDFSPQERSEIHGIIHDETDRLLRMINELLDLSRIQAGKPLKLASTWFDVTRHMQKVAGIARSGSTKHRIDLIIPEDPVWINADADKVDQIVINLMSNAVKYSPGTAVVTLKLIHNDTHVMISVTDQGVGLTADQCAHVFDKFYRVSEQDMSDTTRRSRKVEGSGIGLYLTRSLVEAHRGSITVASNPGEGSIFTVTLPKNAVEQASSASTKGVGRTRAALIDASLRHSVPHLLRTESLMATDANFDAPQLPEQTSRPLS